MIKEKKKNYTFHKNVDVLVFYRTEKYSNLGVVKG